MEGDADIRTIHELLGHSDVQTGTVRTHELNRGGMGAEPDGPTVMFLRRVAPGLRTTFRRLCGELCAA